MSRSRTTGRYFWSTRNPVTLACPCGRRLAVLEIRSDLPHIAPGEVAEGVYYAKTERGEPGVADDWRRIICPQCGRDWRGRVGRITELVRQAQDERRMAEAVRQARSQGDTRVTLENAPVNRPTAPTRLPWSALRIPPDRAPQLVGARDTL
jgi:hypothetical protein